MRVPFLDLKAQYAEVASTVTPQIIEILETGAYVLGKHNKGLEDEIAQYHGVKHAIAVNSGTDALRIMLDAAGVGPGDEVITTAFTFVATIETIMQVGATPVFVDVREHDFMIDPDLIEAAITPKTKAIMPIHLYGQLADMAAINSVATKYGLAILEDAAQAIGSMQNGKYAGNFGISAGISFYVTKNLGAAGDGGIVLTNDDATAEASRSLRVHGMGRERYYYDHVGYTSRMAEIQACFLRGKLQRLEAWHDARREVAAKLSAALAGSDVAVPTLNQGNNHTWHQYTIRTPRRDQLQSFLKEREVDSMVYYPVPLHFHSPYRHIAERGSLPVTERISDEVLSLPVHQYLSDEQIAWVGQSVREFGAVPA